MRIPNPIRDCQQKLKYVLIALSICLCFFGTVFTIIRTFYYGVAPELREYIIPAIMGTAFGIGIGLWRFQTEKFKEKLKRTMAALKSSNDELKQKIQELASANRSLTEAQAKLEHSKKLELIGTISGGVAHDLNNVLCSIVGFPDLLLQSMEKDSPLRDSVMTIKKSGEKAAAIVEDMLTLARRGTAAKETLNLNTLLKEYLSSPEFDNLLKFHPDLQVETDTAPGLHNVIGSSIHLSKTIMNLVSNAAEAQEKGGKVVITTKNVTVTSPMAVYSGAVKKGTYVALGVTDYGTGISSEDVCKIFEPFYSKKKMGRSGTGLGMAVVWGTVMDHNAYIDVNTMEGRGTAFTLYFPMTDKELDDDKALLPEETYQGEGESILVIDDMEEQRKLVSEMLKGLGYTVDSVGSGEDALEYFKRNSADLILLDMFMEPGMDGLETYEGILALCPQQKAIILSGYSETDRVKEALRLGAGQYVSKPYTIAKIGKAVRAELETT